MKTYIKLLTEEMHKCDRQLTEAPVISDDDYSFYDQLEADPAGLELVPKAYQSFFRKVYRQITEPLNNSDVGKTVKYILSSPKLKKLLDDAFFEMRSMPTVNIRPRIIDDHVMCIDTDLLNQPNVPIDSRVKHSFSLIYDVDNGILDIAAESVFAAESYFGHSFENIMKTIESGNPTVGRSLNHLYTILCHSEYPQDTILKICLTACKEFINGFDQFLVDNAYKQPDTSSLNGNK